jgi:HSP20 family molecular chaperone IbpA
MAMDFGRERGDLGGRFGRKRQWGDTLGGGGLGESIGWDPFANLGVGGGGLGAGFDPFLRGRGLGTDFFAMPGWGGGIGGPTAALPGIGAGLGGGFGGGLGAVDWRSDPRWQQFPDADRVYYNPNIDTNTVWRPRADIFDESRFLLRVEFELPGVPSDDIDLSVLDNTITIAALKPQTRKEEGGFYFQRERHFGRFFRTLQLPYYVDPNNVRANLDNGVLKVVLTKLNTPSSRIPIQQGTAVYQPVYPSSGGVGTSGSTGGGGAGTSTLTGGIGSSTTSTSGAGTSTPSSGLSSTGTSTTGAGTTPSSGLSSGLSSTGTSTTSGAGIGRQ